MLAIVPLALAFAQKDRPESHLVAKIPDDCRIVEGSMRFSRDGAKCIYVVTKGEELHPVIGGTLGAAYDEVDWPAIDLSGSHTAFRVREGIKKKKIATYSILYDGKIVATDVWIGPIALDPAKGTLAYWIAHGVINTADGHLEPQAATLEWGKYKSAKWQYAESTAPPEFTPDGRILVTNAARGNGDWNVVSVDDKGKDDKHGNGSIFEAVPRPTGHAVAYTFANLRGEEHWMSRHQQFLVVTASLDLHGDKSTIALFGEKYECSGSPVFTADGLHLAYKVMASSKMGVAVDHQENAPCEFDYTDEIALKPDGSEAAFVGCNGCKLDEKNGREVLHGVHVKGGKWFVVHGTTRSDEYERAHFPTWSRDGKGFAYAAKIGSKWHVFAGSKQSDPCDEVACVTWSEDGWSVYYGCRNGAELWWRRVDAE